MIINTVQTATRIRNGSANNARISSVQPPSKRDSKLVAQAILTLVQLEHMPKRLYLGQPAIGAMQSHINELINEINDNIELSVSIDR